jgi:hypothetical protein
MDLHLDRAGHVCGGHPFHLARPKLPRHCSMCVLPGAHLPKPHHLTRTFSPVLTPAERAVVIERLQEDQQFSAGGETFRWRQVAKASVDPKMWLGMIAYAAVDIPLYAFS